MKTRSKENLTRLDDILRRLKPSEFKDNHLAAYKVSISYVQLTPKKTDCSAHPADPSHFRNYIRFDNFLIPMLCGHAKFGLLLSPGKASSHSTRRYPDCFFFLCAVFLCFHTTGCEAYSFTTDGYGIFNERVSVSVQAHTARLK